MTFILGKKFTALSLAIAALVLVFGASAGAQQDEEIIIKLERVDHAAKLSSQLEPVDHAAELSSRWEAEVTKSEAPVLKFEPVFEKKIEEKIEREVRLEIVFTKNGEIAKIPAGTEISLTAGPGLKLREEKIVTREPLTTVAIDGVLKEGVLPGTVIEIKGVAKLPTGEEIKTDTSFEVTKELLPVKPIEEVREVEREEEVKIDLVVISEVSPSEHIILPERGGIAISLLKKLEEEQLKIGLKLTELSSGKIATLRYNSLTGLFEAKNLKEDGLYQLPRLLEDEQTFFLEIGSVLEPPPAGGGEGGSAYQEAEDGDGIVQSNEVFSADQGNFSGSLAGLSSDAQAVLIDGNAVVTLTDGRGTIIEATVSKDGLVNAQNLNPAESYTIKITDGKGNNLAMLIKVTQGKVKALPPSFGKISGKGALPGILLLAGAGLMGLALLLRSRLARGVWLTMLVAGLIAGSAGLVQSNFLEPLWPELGRPGGGLSTFVPPSIEAACVCSFEVIRKNTQYYDGTFGDRVVATTQNEEVLPATVYVAACLEDVEQSACGRIGGPCQRRCMAILREKEEEMQAALRGIYGVVPHNVNLPGPDDSHDLPGYTVEEWNSLPFDPHEAAVETGIGTMGGEAVGRPWACFDNCDPREGFNWVQGEGPDLEGGSLDYGLGFPDVENIIFGEGYNEENTPPDSANPDNWRIRAYPPEPE